jgi:hypothetical protein
VVGYEDEFSIDQINGSAWTTFSAQDSHSLISNAVSDIFIDPLNFDFHLANNSLAINQGTSTGAPPEDFDGNPRYPQEGIDIGAFEYQMSNDMHDSRQFKHNSKGWKLWQNYPNPFHHTTSIKYEIDKKSTLQLKIIDLTGREIRSWDMEEKLPGISHITWDGLGTQAKPVPSGIYFYTLLVNREKRIKETCIYTII